MKLSKPEINIAIRRSSPVGVTMTAIFLLFYFAEPKAEVIGLVSASIVGFVVTALIFLVYLFGSTAE